MLGSFNWLILLRTILEGIIVIFGVYLLSNTAIIPKRILIWGSVVGIITFLVRLLPINFGVHTIILVLTVIYISTNMCKIDLSKAVAFSIIFIIILFISEWLTIFLYDVIFQYSPDNLLGDSLLGVILTLPSLFIALIITWLISLLLKTKFKKVR